MTSPIAAVRSLPRFAYLSPAEAREVVLAVLGAVDVEVMARAMATADGCDPDDPAFVRYPGPTPYGICWRDKYADKARAAIDALVAEVQEEGR